MPKRSSTRKVRDIPAPNSPSVGVALRELLERGRTVSSLAADAALDRRAIQRIREGLEAPSPESLGRLCAVVSKEDASKLIAAYLADVRARVSSSQTTHAEQLKR